MKLKKNNKNRDRKQSYRIITSGKITFEIGGPCYQWAKEWNLDYNREKQLKTDTAGGGITIQINVYYLNHKLTSFYGIQGISHNDLAYLNVILL